MSKITINSAHIAMQLAMDCFGLKPKYKGTRERCLQSPEIQHAKIQAARDKRLNRQLKRVQEGH